MLIRVCHENIYEAVKKSILEIEKLILLIL